MKRTISTISLAVAVATMCSCASASRKAGPGAATAIQSVTPTVVVRNRQWIDLRVYVITTTGVSYRLGIVPAAGAATFNLSPFVRVPAVVSFVAIPLGNGDPLVVGPTDVDVGTQLLFTVDRVASTSSLVKQR